MEGQHRGRVRIRRAARAGARLPRAPASGLRRAGGHDLDGGRSKRDDRPAPPVSLTGMLAGVVPFPPEFARRYREKGYWRDRSLAREIAPGFKRYPERIALIDRDARGTYSGGHEISHPPALKL